MGSLIQSAGGFMEKTLGFNPINDITGKTAEQIADRNAQAQIAAGQKAREEYSKQYGVGASQVLLNNAAYQSFVLGLKPENTPAGQEYARLYPETISDAQKNPFQTGILGQLSQGNYQQALESMPNYNVNLSSGLNALQNTVAGRGLQSGATQKAIMQYGQNLANDYLMNYLGGFSGLQNTATNAMSYGLNLGDMTYKPAVSAADERARGQIAGLQQRNQMYGMAMNAGMGGMGGQPQAYGSSQIGYSRY